MSRTIMILPDATQPHLACLAHEWALETITHLIEAQAARRDAVDRAMDRFKQRLAQVQQGKQDGNDASRR